jgi:hypothetical protein
LSVSRRGTFRVGLLMAGDGALGAVASLREAPGVKLVAAGTVTDLAASARAGRVDAVAVDPELGTGWPVDTAEQAVNTLPADVAIGIVCRSHDDAEQIEHRVAAAANVTIVLGDPCDAQQLVTILKGLLAAQSTRGSKI